MIHNLRNEKTFATKPVNKVHYASNLLHYLGPKTRVMVPRDSKLLGFVKAFKFAIKKW